ncbi:hypothetical protein RUM44_001506 [Polyplax serrata]|uniref:Uncharacterized protein n=1 Tax=Polyplax serrata TaxID=468196 RepID=A0ABR1ALQ5_POLSC
MEVRGSEELRKMEEKQRKLYTLTNRKVILNSLPVLPLDSTQTRDREDAKLFTVTFERFLTLRIYKRKENRLERSNTSGLDA